MYQKTLSIDTKPGLEASELSPPPAYLTHPITHFIVESTIQEVKTRPDQAYWHREQTIRPDVSRAANITFQRKVTDFADRSMSIVAARWPSIHKDQ